MGSMGLSVSGIYYLGVFLGWGLGACLGWDVSL